MRGRRRDSWGSHLPLFAYALAASLLVQRLAHRVLGDDVRLFGLLVSNLVLHAFSRHDFFSGDSRLEANRNSLLQATLKVISAVPDKTKQLDDCQTVFICPT